MPLDNFENQVILVFCISLFLLLGVGLILEIRNRNRLRRQREALEETHMRPISRSTR